MIVVLIASLATACAPAPPRGQFVQIAEEEALIIYEAATKTETFIRRATFESSAPTFGFLVPTPDKPELAEVSDVIFDTLEEAIAPPIEHRVSGIEFAPFSIVSLPFMTLSRSAAPGAQRAVRVLETKRVAGYEAAILEADDAAALAAWLAENGFDTRPELAAWLAPYVEAKWKLTAFKVGRDETTLEPRFGTSAVRMTFHSDRPFFPYREPADQRARAQGERKLRVYLIAGGKMSGALDHTPDGSTTWPGKDEWAAPLPAELFAALNALELPAPDKNAWLNAYLDASSPRPGTTELYFDRAVDQHAMRPPPIIENTPRRIALPVDLPVLVGLWWLLRARRKRRR